MMFALPCLLEQESQPVGVDFDPITIPSNIILDASTSSKFTFGTGSQIVTWLNDADNTFNATTGGTTTLRPTYVPNILNSHGVVQFDGVDDYVTFSSSVKGSWSNRYFDYTVCLVVYPQTSASIGQILGTSASSSVSQGTNIDILSDGTLKANIRSSLTGTNHPVDINLATNLFEQWNIIIWSGFNLTTQGNSFIRLNGNDSYYDYFNDDVTSKRPFVWNSANHTTTLRLGGYSTGAYFKGYIADFRFIPKALTLETIKLIEGYYAKKYNLKSNLPSGHPYKILDPTLPEDIIYYRDTAITNL